MWEIGKKRCPDAEKNLIARLFTSGIPAEEYKNLHREGSHISQVSGISAQIRSGTAGCGLVPWTLQLSFE